jgi:hypothetical protein
MLTSSRRDSRTNPTRESEVASACESLFRGLEAGSAVIPIQPNGTEAAPLRWAVAEVSDRTSMRTKVRLGRAFKHVPRTVHDLRVY